MKTAPITVNRYSPSFQKLSIYEIENWNKKFLNALLENPEIEKTATKYRDLTIFSHFQKTIFMSTPLKDGSRHIDNIFYINKDTNASDSEILKKIEGFKTYHFDAWIDKILRDDARLSGIRNKIDEINIRIKNKNSSNTLPTEKQKTHPNEGIWQKILKFFK